MPRIVKAGAKILPNFDTGAGEPPDRLLLSDTIEIKKGWRPEDWQKIKNKICLCSLESCAGCPDRHLLEDTIDACIEAEGKL
jgi:hypothetical protein